MAEETLQSQRSFEPQTALVAFAKDAKHSMKTLQIIFERLAEQGTWHDCSKLLDDSWLLRPDAISHRKFLASMFQDKEFIQGDGEKRAVKQTET